MKAGRTRLHRIAPPSARMEAVDHDLRAAGEEHAHERVADRVDVERGQHLHQPLFAAETVDLEAEGRRKLTEKNLDLIVVNEVGRPGTGFGSDTDRAAILARSGEDLDLREWTKVELAKVICDRLAGALGVQSQAGRL